jgi:hypothetical protein
MSEQQGYIPPQKEAAVDTGDNAKPAEGGEKPRVKYDKEKFLETAKRVKEIRKAIDQSFLLIDAGRLAKQGKILEHEMRDMYAAARTEAEAENSAFDENKANEQAQRTLEMAKAGVLSFDELIDATKKEQAEPEQKSSSEGEPKQPDQAEAAQPNAEDPEAAREREVEEAIQKETDSLEVNVSAASKAVEDAGGEDAIKKALEEMPDDGKAALKAKLTEAHVKNMEERQKRYGDTVNWMKSWASMLNPVNVILASDEPIEAVAVAALYASGIAFVLPGGATAFE